MHYLSSDFYKDINIKCIQLQIQSKIFCKLDISYISKIYKKKANLVLAQIFHLNFSQSYIPYFYNSEVFISGPNH